MEATRKRIKESRIDYGVILPVFLLCLIGLVSLYVATDHDPKDLNLVKTLVMQGLWYLIGAAMIVVVVRLRAKTLWRLTPFVYGLGLVVMMALLAFYDRTLAANTGSKNWFAIGSLTFQPSELMKLAFILMLALVVTQHNSRQAERNVKTDIILIGKMLAVTAPVILLLMLQDDFGTMLVFVAIFAGVFLMSGITWKIVAPAIILVVIVGGLGIFLVTTDSGRDILSGIGFKAYQFSRIDSWLDPFHDTQGNSYQLAQGLMAIGSGGFSGKGFNVSTIYVPVRESDMIFTVIGENFGFIGGAFVILLYFILIYRMIRVCFEMNNEFYAYIATGIIMMILFHVFENIGANIGLLPLTGIPLPFISQGGSSIIGNMLGIGLILSMYYQTTKARQLGRL